MASRRAVLTAPIVLFLAVLAMTALVPSASAATRSAHSAGKTLQWRTPTYFPDDFGVTPSCVSTDFCLAVSRGGAIYRYDGARWAPTSRVGDPVDDERGTGLSCVAETFCMLTDGVGRAFRFDGTRWTASRPLTGVPSALSCASDQTCMLVSPDGHAYQYRNQKWHQTEPISDPSAGQQDVPSVRDVSCLSVTFCLAVSATADSGTQAYRFDGASWHQVGGFATDPSSYVTHVSCASPQFCVAADSTNSASVFDGTAWTAPEVLDPPVYDDDDYDYPYLLNPLTNISCWAPDACITMGAQGFFGRYDGSGWQRSHVQVAADSVSCLSADFCVVGQRFGTQIWDGTKVSAGDYFAPEVLGDRISCVRATFCMVMGRVLGGAAVYDGHRLAPSAAAFPDVATRNMASWPAPSLDCVSDHFCLAVDAHEAAVWNGKRWGPPREIDNRTLVSVSCASVSLCMAFDDHGRALTFRDLQWSAPRHVGLSTAVSVACAPGPVCAAVDYTGIARVYRSGRWSPRQDLGSADDAPFSVSCGSMTLCLIADTNGTVFRYRGSAFGHGRSVFPHAVYASTFAMSCVGDSFCAIADVNRNGRRVRTAVWTAADSWGAKSQAPRPIDPLTNPDDAELESAQDLSCPSAHRCFASYQDFVSEGIVSG